MIVTGGAGVLGSSVAAVARKQGAEVFLSMLLINLKRLRVVTFRWICWMQAVSAF